MRSEWGEVVHPDGSTTPLQEPEFSIPEDEREIVIDRPGLTMWTVKR